MQNKKPSDRSTEGFINFSGLHHYLLLHYVYNELLSKTKKILPTQS